jgi:hypothetical protein
VALDVGTRLGPYEILAPLGAGGMGEVYRARDRRLDRDVAVKVLPAALAGDPDRLRRFENEARAAARLNHPSILQIHDVGTHEGHPYLVTELLEGGTLRERLAGGALSARRAVEYGIGVAQGLSAAHDEGIVHRDLKPENLFLTNDGRVKILDFGLAKLTRPEPEGDETVAHAPTVGEDTEAGVVMGTVGYMSPEQVRGQRADARSDIFTFGAILFEMVSGQRAFRGETPADTMSAILKEDPPELTLIAKEIPPAFDRIVHRCLEKSPTRRFRSAQDLAFSLEAISTSSTGSGLGGVSAVGDSAEHAEVEFEQITHLPSYLHMARFAPDGQTVVYATRIDGGPLTLYMKRPETPEAIPIPIAGADLLAISASGEMAIQLNPFGAHAGVSQGTLALAPMFGGAPRPLAEDITHVDFDPTGRQLAVIREVGGSSRLEYPMGTVLYETSGHVSYARVSPRGDRIAFLDHPMTNDDRSSVAVIDLEGAKKTLTPEWASAQGLAWTPDGEEIWFAATKGGAFRSSIQGVTLSGDVRQVYAVPGSIRIHDISKDGSAVVTRENYSAGILCVGAGGAAERELGWLGYSLPTAISADGKMLLFTEQSHSVGRDYAICIRGTDGSPVVRLGEGTGLGLTPDGRWALSHLPYRDAPFDFHPTGLGQKRSFPKRGYMIVGHRARFTPDGARAVMVVHDETGAPGLLVLAVADGDTRFLPFPAEFTDLRPSYAVDPSGREAIVGHVTTGVTRIVPLDGSATRPGPRLEPYDVIADYAPDGASLHVQAGPQRVPLRVHRVNVETGSREPWLEYMPANRAGLVAMANLQLSRDASIFAVACARHVADLYVARGLA